MALNDIKVYEDGTFGLPGSKSLPVLASATLIYEGEPIRKDKGQRYALPLDINKPVVGTDFMAGIATSTSTNTASVNGTVEYTPIVPGLKYLIAPKVALAGTQAAYDAVVGRSVLFDLTAGSYTLLVVNNDTYGCVIEPLDVSLFPGKICFSLRQGCSYLA